VEPQEYDAIMRSLVRIAEHQDTINDRVVTAITRLDTAITRLDTAITQIGQTLTAIKDMLGRSNGRP
jgi:hypothetical protein